MVVLAGTLKDPNSLDPFVGTRVERIQQATKMEEKVFVRGIYNGSHVGTKIKSVSTPNYTFLTARHVGPGSFSQQGEEAGYSTWKNRGNLDPPLSYSKEMKII